MPTLMPRIRAHFTFWERPGLPKGVAQISICRIADFQSADVRLEVPSE
jgi:hypothetical protein